ncbi:MAG TPA: hypothetical protein VMT35_10765 [Ignavibacteriaceae bacterium]|nr:hypothetical protein [Ignavibacteriaceae bacterium]
MNEIHVNINPSIFKYNMSFYYQSTIFYLAAFLVYLVIRGEFVEDSFHLITKDPIIYLFGFIVLFSLFSLLFNIYKNRYVSIESDKILFINRFKTKAINFSQIKRIRITQKRKKFNNHALRLIRINLENRRRPVVIRPYDYENNEQLIRIFFELKSRLEKK